MLRRIAARRLDRWRESFPSDASDGSIFELTHLPRRFLAPVIGLSLVKGRSFARPSERRSGIMGSAARVTTAAEGLPRRRFTVAEVEAMVAAGVMEEDERVELIGGELVPM
jgi:hypothetical protein